MPRITTAPYMPISGITRHPMTVLVTPSQHCRSSESRNRPCGSTVGPLELVRAEVVLQNAHDSGDRRVDQALTGRG
jgi:hypothetical protein